MWSVASGVLEAVSEAVAVVARGRCDGVRDDLRMDAGRDNVSSAPLSPGNHLFHREFITRQAGHIVEIKNASIQKINSDIGLS